MISSPCLGWDSTRNIYGIWRDLAKPSRQEHTTIHANSLAGVSGNNRLFPDARC